MIILFPYMKIDYLESMSVTVLTQAFQPSLSLTYQPSNLMGLSLLINILTL